ncbi:MAG: flagellar biosynthesis protein FlhB [Deltaproteobacteria bacterium]|nr:flagellar biosynthesis protein FlhB [Deltaproteobacteria bacterium]
MAEDKFQDKTEPATPRRREEARKKGEVAKSRELASIAVLSGGVLYLFFAARGLSAELASLFEKAFSRVPGFSEPGYDIAEVALLFIQDYLRIVLPLMIVLFVVAVLSNYLQTGVVWSVEPLAPKASKINPIQGLQRIFSRRTLMELGKSTAKIVIVGWAAYSTLKEVYPHLLPLIYQDRWAILSCLGSSAWKVTIRCVWVIAILAIIDYVYQRWEFEQKLRMTKQEVKDEFKQTEGDPLVKARIRSIQREMARRRMMEEVPKADVVITNPEHLAVALRYAAERMSAPRVVAKGAERIALKIKELAKDRGVPIVENRPLAQNLYKLDLGDEIPARFYQAVAEILAYVYRLKNKEGRMQA